MKQWLFVIKPAREDMLTSGPTPDEAASVGKHFAYWQQLVVGRTQTTGPETIGLAVFRAETDAEATQIANNDPAVLDGVFTMSLLPYQVALLGSTGPFMPQ